MSRTGGGHLASARALEAEFLAQRPGATITIVDLLSDHIAFPFSRLPRTYDTVVSRTPRLWHAVWRATALRAVGSPSAALVRRLSRARLRRLFATVGPDLVVSVHPLVNHLVLPLMRRLAPQARYVTVVTDLGGIHPLWLHPRNAAIYLPTEHAVDMAAARGIDRARLFAHGLPVRADFSAEPGERAAIRAGFGLDPALPAVLVMGGGGGIGPIEAIVGALARALSSPRPQGQIVVLTAKNEKLRARLATAAFAVPVVPLGYVEHMSDLMHASDLLVTKAGPGTIAEASVRGLPMILYGFIPGQEAKNVDHVVEAGAGLFEPDPARIGTAAARLLADPAALAAMGEKARALGRGQATRDIVASILAGLDGAQG